MESSVPVLRAGTRLKFPEVPGSQPGFLTSVLWDTPMQLLAFLGSSGLLFPREKGSPASCLEKPFLNAGAGNRISGSLQCPGSEQLVVPHAVPELHLPWGWREQGREGTWGCHLGMLWSGGSLQAGLCAPESATGAPGTICSPAVSDLLANLTGVVFAGCACLGSSVLLCSGDFTQSFQVLMKSSRVAEISD